VSFSLLVSYIFKTTWKMWTSKENIGLSLWWPCIKSETLIVLIRVQSGAVQRDFELDILKFKTQFHHLRYICTWDINLLPLSLSFLSTANVENYYHLNCSSNISFERWENHDIVYEPILLEQKYRKWHILLARAKIGQLRSTLRSTEQMWN
jgi:hypothetical protein